MDANITIEEKLRLLFDLQIIDSRIDEIRSVRGELPVEIETLNGVIQIITDKLDKAKQTIEELDFSIKEYHNKIDISKSLIKKYEEKLNSIRNNREYNSIKKEEEFQYLEIELSEKRIKQSQESIEIKNQEIETLNAELEEKNKHLKIKDEELKEIMKETEKEENMLLSKSEEYSSKIDQNLVKKYKRIRSNVKNGLAIVPIERGASGGSFLTVPPQIQAEIFARKRIITDEYNGRILVDAALAKEENEKISQLIETL